MKTSELNILDILVTTFHWIVSVDLHDAEEREHKRRNCKGGLHQTDVAWTSHLETGLYSMWSVFIHRENVHFWRNCLQQVWFKLRFPNWKVSTRRHILINKSKSKSKFRWLSTANSRREEKRSPWVIHSLSIRFVKGIGSNLKASTDCLTRAALCLSIPLCWAAVRG